MDLHGSATGVSSDALPQEQPPVTRSPDLWFEDGSVILQAETMIFRVYRGILAAQSSVFRDMFSVPQPSEHERMDECPFVHLHDSAEDLGYFLKALLDARLEPHSWTLIPF